MSTWLPLIGGKPAPKKFDLYEALPEGPGLWGSCLRPWTPPCDRPQFTTKTPHLPLLSNHFLPFFPPPFIWHYLGSCPCPLRPPALLRPNTGALQPARTASSHGLDLLGRGRTQCAESNLFASIGAQNFMFLDKRMRWGLDRSPLHDTPICGCTRLMWRSHVAGSNYPSD